ncbi:hypothetical protein N9146_03535, partial [Akkermansiaceae bacterium]|nr:hypothetical protein [Akkermansiaceae bacterium]
MTYFAFSCVIVLAYLLVRSNKRQQGAESKLGRLREKLLLDARNQDKSHNRDLQQLLDALPQAFFSITKEGVVNRINSQAGRIFDGRDILNKNIDQVFLDSAMRSLLLKKLS